MRCHYGKSKSLDYDPQSVPQIVTENHSPGVGLDNRPGHEYVDPQVPRFSTASPLHFSTGFYSQLNLTPGCNKVTH